MRKRILCLLLVLLVVALCGCETETQTPEAETSVPATTEATVPATVPEDGDPENVTCQGSYTSAENGNKTVASIGSEALTNGQLWAWYQAAAAQYRQENHEISPDFDKPLDTQVCELDDSVNSWQQYFLRQALIAWHTAKALELQGVEDGLPTEEAYQPIKENHEKYLQNIPATRYLYGFNESFRPNTMHEEYLDSLSTLLEELRNRGKESAAQITAADLADFARLYNYGYTYFTNLGYYIENTQEEIEAFAEEQKIPKSSDKYVDMRHVLVIPDAVETKAKDGSIVTDPVKVAPDGTVTCSEEVWAACEKAATGIFNEWRYEGRTTEARFLELAYRNSEDTGSASAGGAYTRVQKGQLTPVLDAWCFDAKRQVGDAEVLRSEYGYHVVYFCGSTDIWYAEAEKALTARKQQEILTAARERFPMEVDYSAITLPGQVGTVSYDDVLYPDVAHERYPQVPLYLQQDYQKTLYGAFRITTHGCGITTMAMLASYMTDEEITPPELCAQYGRYCHVNGTDGMLFINEAPVLGFFFKERLFDWRQANTALEEGYLVVAIQHQGYWTRGGHYLLFEELTEDGKVRVRDSNIFNYSKLPEHNVDKADWYTLTKGGSGYWVFEPKVTRNPACSRCGEPETAAGNLLRADYFCEKCETATLRRETYLNHCGA